MKHEHRYNASGQRICCTQEEKINTQAHSTKAKKVEHSHEDGHDHEGEHENKFALFLPSLISLSLLLAALTFDNFINVTWFTGWIRTATYILAYLPVGWPVIKEAIASIGQGEYFSEFLLMSIATLGAFAIQEYPEAVAVMLFYAVGEVFQTLAVTRAKSNIKALLDQRPDTVTLWGEDGTNEVAAETVKVEDVIQLKPGEKLALDGDLLSESASFNTSALTGESKPYDKKQGETILAGMINLNQVCLVKVTTPYNDSKLSKILELVQNATAQKAPSELFIRKFAKKYTPVVVALAVAICVLPYFFVDNYVFNDWLYRALVFLVISCPCALVISIPLGYFGGIGAASKNGILFKGSNFLDSLADIDHVVMDKTGTMTEGVFDVQDIVINTDFDESVLLAIVNAVESQSTHPVATAIGKYVGEVDSALRLEDVREIPGHGLRALVDGHEVLVGNFKLLDKFNVVYDLDPATIVHTVIAIGYKGQFAGYLTIADTIKLEASPTISKLKALGIGITMLSGDKRNVVELVAQELGIEHAFGELLPEDKVARVSEIKSKGQKVAFIGDGFNDAPVIAMSDVGIAMGGLGSDATIETADVVIQDDNPIKIPMAIRIGKQTKRIVWQNIGLAFSVKAVVLMLGAGGLATMWEAVFADVGVALLAILNAVRIQNMSFSESVSDEDPSKSKGVL